MKKPSNPLISVVMSVYNSEKFLEEAIESILNQSYENFEFIIIDDGSTDNTLRILNQYHQKDNRIKIISRENKGLAYSLNEGINIAKGEYIARMDADDIATTDRFEKQIKFMRNNDLDICGAYVNIMGDVKKNFVVRQPVSDKDIKFTLIFMSPFSHPSIMMKKKIFDKVRYSDYAAAQDYKLWTDIAKHGYKMGNLPEVVLHYRIHQSQISSEKIELQTNIANEIALDYARSLHPDKTDIIEKMIRIKSENDYETFKELCNTILLEAQKNDISKETVVYILKYIYHFRNRNPLIYYFYYQTVKHFNVDFRENIKIFIKSLLPV